VAPKRTFATIILNFITIAKNRTTVQFRVIGREVRSSTTAQVSTTPYVAPPFIMNVKALLVLFASRMSAQHAPVGEPRGNHIFCPRNEVGTVG
jgi:hypothetical protein